MRDATDCPSCGAPPNGTNKCDYCGRVGLQPQMRPYASMVANTCASSLYRDWSGYTPGASTAARSGSYDYLDHELRKIRMEMQTYGNY